MAVCCLLGSLASLVDHELELGYRSMAQYSELSGKDNLDNTEPRIAAGAIACVRSGYIQPPHDASQDRSFSRPHITNGR